MGVEPTFAAGSVKAMETLKSGLFHPTGVDGVR